MPSIEQWLTFILVELEGYFKRILAFVIRPYREARLTRNTPQRAIFWVCITATLCTLLYFPVDIASPSMMPDEDSWEVRLDTPQDRAEVTSFEYLTKTSGLLPVAIGLISQAMISIVLVRLVNRRRLRLTPFSRMYLAYLTPLCIALLLDAIITLILFKAAYWSAIPNDLFLPLWLVLIVPNVYVFFVIPILALSALGRVSFGKALGISLATSVCMIPLALVFSAVQRTLAPERGDKLLTTIKAQAYEDFKAEKLDQAIDLINDGLKVAPQSLLLRTMKSDMLMARLMGDEINFLSNKSTDAKFLIERYDEVESYDNTFGLEFPDDPAVQLFVAEDFVTIGDCERAQIAYSTALSLPQALPHERVIAANALANFLKPTPLAKHALQQTTWHADTLLGNIVMIPRIIAAEPEILKASILFEGGKLARSMIPQNPKYQKVKQCDKKYTVSDVVSSIRPTVYRSHTVKQRKTNSMKRSSLKR